MRMMMMTMMMMMMMMMMMIYQHSPWLERRGVRSKDQSKANCKKNAMLAKIFDLCRRTVNLLKSCKAPQLPHDH